MEKAITVHLVLTDSIQMVLIKAFPLTTVAMMIDRLVLVASVPLAIIVRRAVIIPYLVQMQPMLTLKDSEPANSALQVIFSFLLSLFHASSGLSFESQHSWARI